MHQIAPPQRSRHGGLELTRCQPGGMHRADQRQRDIAAVVDPEFAGQVLLAEGDDAHLVSRAETVRCGSGARQKRQIAPWPAAADERQQGQDAKDPRAE